MNRLAKSIRQIVKTCAAIDAAGNAAGPMVGEKFRANGKTVQEQDIYMDGTWKWEDVYVAKSEAGAAEIARQRNQKYKKA